jgi:histidinol dehydrogenase
LPDAVEAAVAEQLTSLPRAAIVRDALTHARAIVTPDLDTAFEVSNRYAPEHLVLQVEHAATWLPRIEAAGSVFLGWWTPETLGDYCSGTNHVLPTYGHARSCSGLSVEDFQLAISVQEATPAGLALLGPTARILAELEGLDAHARAVTMRLDALGEPLA